MSLSLREKCLAPPRFTRCVSCFVLSLLRPQSFGLMLDTGSSDLWFATTGCSGCNRGTPLLDTTKSSSFQTRSQTITLSYGSGDATGTLVRDIVSMGPLAVTQQDFGEHFQPTLPRVFHVSDPLFRVKAVMFCTSMRQAMWLGGGWS